MNIEIFGAVSEYYNTLPPEQVWAWILFLLMLFIFRLSASNSYKVSGAGRVGEIRRENRWPERIVKAIWIGVAYIWFDNLWVAALTSFATAILLMTQPWLISLVLTPFIPIITDEERQALDREYGGGVFGRGYRASSAWRG